VKISHEQYLKQTLKSSKIELESLNTRHQVAIAEYNTKKAMLMKQIESIERQLDND
jgi:hypothetical protein